MTEAARAQVGPYRIVRSLGSGAMGTVYLAEDERRERVALKVVHPHLLRRQGFFGRFEREAEAGRRVDHPNVVRTLGRDLLLVEGVPWCFLVMEYVEGRTLRALLDDLGTVPEALVREIGRQVAEGLAAIHAAGVVHRDLKPENVLVASDHRVRIMDLGVARIQDASVALTREGQFAGSLLYAAPEQFQPGAVGPAADLYALGVVLHELATGTNPFRAPDAAAVVRAHLEGVVPGLTEVDPDLSPFLAEVVRTLLDREPSGRFSSAADLARVLEEGERSSWWGEREGQRLRVRAAVPRVPVRRETGLHGREQDLALLRDLWAIAKEGKGSTILVEGEAGIGKSRLVDAFLEGLGAQDAHVLYGSYPPTGGRGALADAIVGTFGGANLADALRPYLRTTPTLVDPFAAFLVHEVPPEGSPVLQRDALHAVVVHLMRGLAAEKPLLWVAEDLHFADADRRQLLLALVRAVEGHRVLLLLTTRPRGLPAEEAAMFGRTESFRRTTLGRLGARDVALLLRDAFRSEQLAERLGARIALQSDGIPFFVLEMVRGLKDGPCLTPTGDGSWVESKPIDEIGIPSALLDLVEARLGGLGRDERTVLDVASVQGFDFDGGLVAQVLERRPVAVLQDLADLERRSGLLRAAGRIFRFEHHLVQEVLYRALPPALREEYHARVAERLLALGRAGADAGGALAPVDVSRVAFHHVRGTRPAAAAPLLLPALDHLTSAFRHEEAVDLARRALARDGLLEGTLRLDVLLRAAQSLDLLGRPEEEGHLLVEAEGLAGGSAGAGWLARVHQGMVRRLASMGKHAEALDWNRQALEEAARAGEVTVECAVRRLLVSILNEQGRAEESLAEAVRLEALGATRGDWRVVADATLGMAIARAGQGRWEDTLALLERARAALRPPGDPAIEAKITAVTGRAHLWTGRIPEARRHLEEALRRYREIGDRWGETNYTNTLGITYAAEGRHEESRVFYQRYLEMAREIGDRRAEGTAIGNLGEAYSHLGRIEEADRCYRRQWEMSREDDYPRGEVWALEGVSRVLVWLGRTAEAHSHVALLRERSRAIQNPTQEAYACALEAQLAENEGSLDEAERFHREALSLWRRHSSLPTVDGLIELALVVLRQGRRDEARTLLEEARSTGTVVEQVPLATLLLAGLEGSAGTRPEAVATAEGRFSRRHRMLLRHFLWQATGDPAHLLAAKGHLDHLVDHAPPEHRESMVRNVLLHREIAEARMRSAEGRDSGGP